MSRALLILYQAAFTFSFVSSLQNNSSTLNNRQPFSVGAYEEICTIIRECNAATFNKDFVRYLILKVTGLSDMGIFQLGTENCHTTTAHPRIRECRARGYRCQQKGIQMSAMKRSMSPDCRRHGYKTVRAGRDTIHIKLHLYPKTWDEALNICRTEGALLAIPNTKEKDDAMMKLRRNNQDVWIGLRDAGQNNTFVWMDGNPLRYTNWMRNEPSHTYGHQEEDCAEVIPEFDFNITKYVWNDVSCADAKAFLCQCL